MEDDEVMTTMPTTLADHAIYIGDNGRLCCNALRCAGSTALTTGRDLSGQAVERLDVAAVKEWLSYGYGPPSCECGRVTLSEAMGPDGWPAVKPKVGI